MKNKIKCIIVSGPDNCGKDTVCEQLKVLLQNELGVYPAYISSKFSKEVNDWRGEMMRLKKFVDDFITSGISDTVLLLNRSWFDEDVYGPIYRDYGERDNDWLYFDIHDTFKNIVYVHLTAPADVLAEREDGKSFSKGLHGVIETEKSRFDYIEEKLAQDTDCNVLAFDTSQISREDIGRDVFDAINEYDI